MSVCLLLRHAQNVNPFVILHFHFVILKWTQVSDKYWVISEWGNITSLSIVFFCWELPVLCDKKCAWPPKFLESFSKKVLSLASPGRKHSSSWKLKAGSQDKQLSLNRAITRMTQRKRLKKLQIKFNVNEEVLILTQTTSGTLTQMRTCFEWHNLRALLKNMKGTNYLNSGCTVAELLNDEAAVLPLIGSLAARGQANITYVCGCKDWACPILSVDAP